MLGPWISVDNAVALVQAYLRVNGYFTVAEYPVIGWAKGPGYHAATDLDILAVRFPHSRQDVVTGARSSTVGAERVTPDAALGAVASEPDMIIGEVKEGRAILNAAATDPAILRAALVRFGCCYPEDADHAVSELLQRGEARLAIQHRVRLVAFGSERTNEGTVPCRVVTHGQIVAYLTDYIRRYWNILRHAETKDPALGTLMLLEKARWADGQPPRPSVRRRRK